MTWAKFSDHVTTDLEIREAGTAGYVLHTAGIIWCGRHLTDGVIPKKHLADVWRPVGERFRYRKAAAKLTSLGLWIEHKDSFQIVDYLKDQPSREQVLTMRIATNERVRKFRSVSKLGQCNAVTNTGCTDSPYPNPIVNKEDYYSYDARKEPPPAPVEKPMPPAYDYANSYSPDDDTPEIAIPAASGVSADVLCDTLQRAGMYGYHMAQGAPAVALKHAPYTQDDVTAGLAAGNAAKAKSGKMPHVNYAVQAIVNARAQKVVVGSEQDAARAREDKALAAAKPKGLSASQQSPNSLHAQAWDVNRAQATDKVQAKAQLQSIYAMLEGKGLLGHAGKS